MQRFRAKRVRKDEPTRSALGALPVLDLPPQESWRTSLILPHLASQFTLLRDEDGSLVSEASMQDALRAQRQEGKITAEEERAVMHEFRVQSGREAGPSAFSRGPRKSPRQETKTPQTLDDFHRSRVSGRKGQHSHTKSASRDESINSRVFGRDNSLPSVGKSWADDPDYVESPHDLSNDPSHRVSRVMEDLAQQLSPTQDGTESQGADAAGYEELYSARDACQPLKPNRPALKTTNSANATVSSPGIPRSPSSQGSIHDSVEGLRMTRTPTPGSAGTDPRQREARSVMMNLARDTSSPPGYSSEAHYQTSAQAVEDEDADVEVPEMLATESLYSAGANLSRYSTVSTTSSFQSEEDTEEEDVFDAGKLQKTGRKPFEYDPSPPDVRPSIDEIYEEALLGLTLSDVAMLQEALVRTATARALATSGRPNLPRTRSDSSASANSRFGASTPASQLSRLDDVEEIEDELAEQLDTPLLDSATQSPSASSHDTHSVFTPPSISPSNSQHALIKPKQPGMPATPPPVPTSPDLPFERKTSSRAAISNPAYKPGRPFPIRSTSTSAASSPLQKPLPLSQQIAAQAAAATEALKQSPVATNTSPSHQLRRAKSNKGLKANIGAPQLISTSANLSGDAVRDLPKPFSSTPTPAIDARHQRSKSGSSSGASLRSKMMRQGGQGRPGAGSEELTPFELPPLPPVAPTNPLSSNGTPKTPSTGFTSPNPDNASLRSSPVHPSPLSAASPASQSSIHRMLTRLRKGKGNDPISPRSPPVISPPRLIPGHSPGSSMSTRPLPAAAAIYGLGLADSEPAPGSQQPVPGAPAYPPASEQESPRASESSIRQLMQAAAELGIDSDKVNDLLKTAASPTTNVVKRTIIIASDETRVLGDPATIRLKSPPLGGRGPRRSETSPVGRQMIGTSEVVAYPGHRALADRPPTPPATGIQHLRESQDLRNEPVPALPPGLSISSPIDDREVEETHEPTHDRHLRPERARRVSDLASDGSRGSLLDFYNEEDNVPSLLAAGHVNASGDKRRSVGNVEVAMAAVKSADAHVEVDEMQDGSLLWQVVRNLRRSGTSDPSSPSVTGGFHSRSQSDASSVKPSGPSSGPRSAPTLARNGTAPGARSSDPMAFLIRRQRMTSNDDSNPRHSSEGSDRSVQVFEAAASDVNALVDELVSKHEAGSFNLVRSQSVQRILGARSPPQQSSPSLL